MIVFKTFLKVLKTLKVPVILYTVMLVIFGGLNMSTSDNTKTFETTKPSILIVNNDTNEGVTSNLIKYVEANSKKVNVGDSSDEINDALFYREIEYIIYIPENYREQFLNKENPKIEVKSTGSYNSSLAEMILSRYLRVANIYNNELTDENEIIKSINNTLSKELEVEMTTTLDVNKLARASIYFNFANYSILAGCVYVICLVLASFRAEKIKKRTVISSMNYKKYNQELLLSSSISVIALWVVYVLLGFIIIGDVMLSLHGLMYIINSFIFSINCLTVAFLIGNIINNKDAINGIINIISLGTSFLCGAFIPAYWLPDTVIMIAHIFPSYYYIASNDIISTIEIINFSSLKPVLINMGIILLFTVGTIILTNYVSKCKRKIA